MVELSFITSIILNPFYYDIDSARAQGEDTCLLVSGGTFGLA
jgi:hypothetical protein